MLIGCAPWCKRLFQPLKCNSFTPREASELAKLQAESYVGVRKTVTLELAHETALRRRYRFFHFYSKACAAQQRAWFKATTAAHRTTRGIDLRASYGQDLEKAELFVLLSVVYTGVRASLSWRTSICEI